MCLGIPLKIIEINGNNAIGEMNGIKRNIRVDFIKDIKIGDYVMVHAGFALDKMNEELAKETIQCINEVNEAACKEN